MSMPLYVVDAFAERPFAGNPAAVCLLPGEQPSEWMQRVGSEMNLSETAFVWPIDGGFNLRWFTPTVEVDLCGHATLASAHVLWETRTLPVEKPARFLTRSGWLTCIKNANAIEMDFPAKIATTAEPPAELVAALGAAPRWAGTNRMDWLVLFESESAVRELRPDFALLAQLPVRGVIVTARSQAPEFDFVSRFFAPGAGVAEDPVTGSAHCALGPFWAERLGKTALRAHQVSARGGVVRVRVNGDRVVLGGTAVTVVSGELLV